MRGEEVGFPVLIEGFVLAFQDADDGDFTFGDRTGDRMGLELSEILFDFLWVGEDVEDELK